MEELEIEKYYNFNKKDRFLIFYRKVYLPQKYYTKIINKCYNISTYRYQGLKKTLESIS